MILEHPKTLLGKVKPQQFLKDYWQKKPLLVKGGYKNLPRLVSPDELAGLSCEKDLVSRLILEKGGRKPWEVLHGPFSPKTFTKLPKKSWTLLVNGVDRYIPEVNRLVDSFRFIPNWRIEDVMISYAVDKGNVGAHVDDFDVFLIQAEGRREWRIEETPQLEDEFRQGLDIKLLKRFKPTKTWVLEPGDMLYLPPRFAHHGIAKGDGCMTISVGFRAPSHTELLTSALGETFEKLDDRKRYSDPDLKLQNPGEISAQSLKKVRGVLESMLPEGDELALWFGKFVTQQREGAGEGFSEGPALTPAMLKKHVAAEGELLRNEGARLAYTKLSDGEIVLFVNGETVEFTGKRAAKLAALITDGTVLKGKALTELVSDAGGLQMCLALICAGVLYLPE